MPQLLPRRAAAALAGLLVAAPLALVGPSAQAAPAPAAHVAAVQPAAAKSCKAYATPTDPKQYTYVDIRVAGTTSGAKITTTAHYKTTNTTKSATADSKGKATISYYISGATVGYRVYVDVKATKGSTTWTCRTSFVPKSR